MRPLRPCRVPSRSCAPWPPPPAESASEQDAILCPPPSLVNYSIDPVSIAVSLCQPLPPFEPVPRLRLLRVFEDIVRDIALERSE